MASFRNLPMVALVAGLSLPDLCIPARADEQAKEPANGEPATVAAAGAKPGSTEKESKRLDIPVPKGQPQKGIRFPIFDPDGKLMFKFNIGVAEVVDDEHVKLSVAHIESFRQDGEHEFDIDLSDAVLNPKTQDLDSNARVMIKRREFELSGNHAIVNLRTKLGKLTGGVKMIIYDADAAFGPGTEKSAAPSIEVKPLKQEPK